MRRLLALLLPLALVAASCGDDDTDASAPEGATTTTTAPVEGGGADGDADAEEATTSTSTTAVEGTVPTDAPAAEAPAGAGDDDGLGDAVLVADLTPEAEVPGPGATGGTGRFEAELVDGQLCIDMVVRNLGDVTFGAHVHEGAAGEAGPVVVDLGDPTSGSPSEERWVDSCTEVPDDVIERLAAAPEQHYVNVHTPSFPDGAVRGQLGVASVFDRTLD